MRQKDKKHVTMQAYMKKTPKREFVCGDFLLYLEQAGPRQGEWLKTYKIIERHLNGY